MARNPSKVDGKEIVFSQTILFEVDQTVVMHPLTDDHSHFAVKFILINDVDKQEGRTYYGDDQDDADTFTVKHCRGWRDGKISANIGQRAFLHDDRHSYFITFSVDVIGNQDRHAYRLSFSVLRGARA